MPTSSSQDLQILTSNHNPVGSAASSDPVSDGTAAIDQRPHGKRTVKKSNQICRFYGTKKGCRAGSQCPYRHEQQPNNQAVSESVVQDESTPHTPEIQTGETSSVRQPTNIPRAPPVVRNRAPVSKPVSTLQQKDPREFQIGQVIRRFSPIREDIPTGTLLKLKLKPSDPDFPFELDALECVLNIPATYPQDGRPSIRVENKGIPRGFQINVERGFDALCSGSASSNRTLLQLLNDLDRHLERFLTNEKTQTIKIVANRGEPKPIEHAPVVAEPSPEPIAVAAIAKAPDIPRWTAQQKTDAKAKRDTEIRQLEARMSRVPMFSSSKDGLSFNVPLQIPKPQRLPLALHPLKEVTLIVPSLYDLEACRIKLKGVFGPEAEKAERAFETHATEHRDMTLMAHINHLTQNIHVMATPPAGPGPGTAQFVASTVDTTVATPVEPASQISDSISEIVDEERPHLRFLSQPPPEWTRRRNVEEEPDSDSSEYDTDIDSSGDSEDAQSQAGGASLPVAAPITNLEKGVLLSFPHMELHGIELLELRDISISIKCDRCKESMDIKTIKPADPASNSIRTESCNKCASPVSVSYRPEPMHANSVKAGYLDLEGCTIVDMLPSHFLPTCSECSTTAPAPGIISVRGESPTSVCRECHHRLNFQIPEIKFLRVSSNDPRLNLPLRSKRKKDNLGITAGTELPERGRCRHYSKSYRWFRFSCCNRVYPCDRCHDEKEEHMNEHANRMICGWCSREQNYRPEDCNVCGRSVIRKRGGGFWEGGKGTRDKARMSRKDPRKYKRIGRGAKAGEK